MGATTSKTHERRAAFAQAVGQAVRHKYQPDVDKVAAYLRSIHPNLREDEAQTMAKTRPYAKYVRTESRPVDEMVSRLEAIVDQHSKLDERDVSRGGLPLLRPDLPAGKSGPIGARAALAKLISCLRKGCGTDPLPVEYM